MKAAAFSSIDEYIEGFPPGTRAKLSEIRSLIRAEAPEAGEKISYQMPTFYLHGNLVHFAGYARHIGFYPGAAIIADFKDELKAYKSAKGSVQFPLDAPLPAETIRKIVRFRVEANTRKAMEKAAKK
jgi:uncharacterized protein YdhG (YjbR/CyaY superfamily)